MLRFLLLTVAIGVNMAPAAIPTLEVEHAKSGPVVDGVLDDSVWQRVEPLKLAPPKKSSSEIRCVWTKAGLFVAFRSDDSHLVYGSAEPGQTLHEEDVFEIFIDAKGDLRQYYEIQMDPAGRTFFKNYILTEAPRSTESGRLTNEFAHSELWRYDLPRPEGVEIASKADPAIGRWVLEIFLPASFINRRNGKMLEPGQWRINFARYDWDQPKKDPARAGTFLYFSNVEKGCPHISPERLGYMTLKKP